MTETTTTAEAAGSAELTDAMNRIRRAREVLDTLAPLRRVIADADEELRAAAMAGSQAGLSERALAAHADVAQPTVRGWLDSRRSDPLPGPGLAEQAWSYHRVASSLATLTRRLTGHQLSRRAPSPSHVAPTDAVRWAIESLDSSANNLGRAASAIEHGDSAKT